MEPPKRTSQSPPAQKDSLEVFYRRLEKRHELYVPCRTASKIIQGLKNSRPGLMPSRSLPVI
jgi:hypothetical protein